MDKSFQQFQQWRNEAWKLVPPKFSSFEMHEFPKFLVDACWNYEKCQYKKSTGVEARGPHFAKSNRRHICSQIVHTTLGSVCDHWGSGIMVADSAPCFVAQPYGMSSKGLLMCEELASKVGVQVMLDPAGQWYPGYTFSVIFTPNN